MTSEERDNLLLYAAGALDTDEMDALRKRFAAPGGATPEEIGALAEAQATLALLPLALDEQSPSAVVKDRLMANLAGLPSAESTSDSLRLPTTPVSASGSRTPMWMALAASVLIFMVSMALIIAARKNMGAQQAQLAARDEQIQQMAADLVLATQSMQFSQAELARANEMLDVARSSQLQLVGLAGPEPADNGPKGRILWDKENNQWLISVHGLQPPAEGREYELWFITADGKKVPSKTFNTTKHGEGMLVVEMPKDVPNITIAAITDEPLGGVPVPTGSIHLVGKLE